MAAPALIKTSPSLDLIGLLRVSTDHQDVARQRTALERLKKKFGITYLRTLELVGVSGTETLNNEQVKQILDDLKNPAVGGIAVSALDRLLRPGKRWAQYGILDYFQDAGKVIYSEREGLVDPTTDEGYAKITQACGTAGAEWRRIQQLSKDGKAEKIAQGRIMSTTAVYGYTYVPKHAWHDHTCQNHPVREIDPEKCGQFFEFGDPAKLDVVTRVYQQRALNTPPYRIAAELNDAGIRSEKGGLWSRGTILQMLARTVYNGRYVYNGETIACPKLIDDDLWNKAQEVREEGPRQWIGRPSDIYLLRGYLWCGHCGHRHIATRSGTRSKPGFYRCGNRTAHPPIKNLCNVSKPVPQDILEQIAWSAVWGLLTQPDLLFQMAQAWIDSMQPQERQGETLEQEAARLAGDDAHIVEMVKRRFMPMSQGEVELKPIRDRIAQIKVELRAAGRILSLPPKNVIEASVRRITEGPEPQTYAGRRDILEGILDLKMSYQGGELEISGKVPVADAADSTTSGRQKCNRRIDSDDISVAYIPFILKRRVA